MTGRKNLLILIAGAFAFIILLLSALFTPALSKKTADIYPSRLRCEYLVDPPGIGVTSPRLFWIVESSKRSQKQEAYRIIVASSRNNLEKNIGDLWDTGKVWSEETIHIEYRGKPLKSRMQCFWKVMIWDGEDNPSDWSETAMWSMGLLDKNDWQAQWIGYDTPAHEIHNLHIHTPRPLHWDLGIKIPGPYGLHKLSKGGSIKIYLPSPFLRKSFTVRGLVKRATIYATALGAFELHLNGERVGKDYFLPGWTDYNQRIYYITYDVTEMIKDGGENILGAILSDGWYAGNINMHGQWFYGTKLRLLAQLHIEYKDGTEQVLVTDDSWRASRGPVMEADMQAGEVYDARREMPGWSAPGFDDRDWEAVDVTDTVEALVQAYPGIPVRKTMEIRPIEITEPEPGIFIFNMGQNFAGRVRLKVKGEAGDKVVLRFGEMLNLDGTLYTANLRSARATDTYILKGGEEETWEPRFTFHGFQYVEVTGYPGEPTLDSVTGVVLHNDLPVTGSFECSHPLVNKLYSNIVWGQRSNYLEVPTDCPQRDERLGWTGDAQVFVRTATYNMDVAPFFTKWMVDLADGQQKNGSFPDVAPDALPANKAAAGWGDAGVICPFTIYKAYGDTRIIEQHYDSMVRFMDFHEQRSPDYISPKLGAYGDWLNINAHTPRDLIATAYFARDAQLMSRMADAVGKSQDAERYHALFEDVRTAYSNAFIDEQGRIKGDTQTAYAMAIRFGLLNQGERARAAQHLVDRIEERNRLLSTGFLGLNCLLPALTEIGRNDVAYMLLTNREYPSWGYSIDQGATTVWERWNSYTKEKGFASIAMNSFNHYAYGSVGEWLFSTLAGIETDGPGYKRIIIRPRPGGDITWARTGYDSIRGRIATHWRFEGNVLKLDVTIPANTAATIYVPAKNKEDITESGRQADKSPGVRFIRMEGSAAVFETGSGNYRFVVKD